VYIVIKAMAKENASSFSKSNLIDLMNHVVDCRRGDIFDDDKSDKQSTT